jgi:hypothetical protein
MDTALERGLIDERFDYNDIRAKSATDDVDELVASTRLGYTTTATTQRVYIRRPRRAKPLR